MSDDTSAKPCPITEVEPCRERPDAAALKLPLPCTERPPVGAKVILLKGENAGKVLTVIRRLEDRPTLVAASDGDYTGAFDYLDLGLAPEPALPPPCMEQPPVGTVLVALVVIPRVDPRPIAVGDRLRLTSAEGGGVLNFQLLDGSRGFSTYWYCLAGRVGLAPAVERPDAAGQALPLPCTERPPVGAEVIRVAAPSTRSLGQRYRVVGHSGNSDFVTVAASFGVDEARLLPWSCLGLAPAAEQPVAPSAPAGDGLTVAQRLEKLEAQVPELGNMVSAQGGCILDLQERQKRDAEKSPSLNQRVFELEDLRIRDCRAQEDFHGPLIERLAEIERRQERARTEEAEQEKRMANLITLVESMDVEGAKRITALEALAHHDHTDALVSRIAALEALPVAQGLRPVVTSAGQTKLTSIAYLQLRAELRGRSACDATFNENTKRLMEERDSLCNQLDDVKSSFDTTTMALQTQLEEARAKLTKAEADFETHMSSMQSQIARLTRERDEAKQAPADAVEQLQAADANFDAKLTEVPIIVQWISVDERLPQREEHNYSDRVLVSYENCPGYLSVAIAYLGCDGVWRADRTDEPWDWYRPRDPILLWAPLPTPKFIPRAKPA